MTTEIFSIHQLDKLCQKLDLKNNPGIYLLRGDLASGKTSFVKAAIKFLGQDDNVTSPTYLLTQKYGKNIYHYDIYRIDLQELLELGFLEEIEQEGWHFVEWGDEKLEQILKNIGLSYKIIEISTKDNAREYKIYA